MASNDNNKPQSGGNLPFDFTKDKLALLIGLMAIVALVFATYNFFNRGAEISSSNTEREEDKVVLKDKTTNTDKKADPTKPSTNGDDATNKNVFDTGSTISGTTKNNNGEWKANNYNKGEITGGSYTVVKGDTLWEIAEAAYGDGSQWTKILAANKDEIGFLPNGRQALIKPGQVLILP